MTMAPGTILLGSVPQSSTDHHRPSSSSQFGSASRSIGRVVIRRPSRDRDGPVHADPRRRTPQRVPAVPERFEILTQRRHADVVGMFELGDRSLGHIESTCEFGLADGFAVTEFVELDLFERVDSQRREPLGRTGAGNDVVAEFGELGSCHQINPSSSISRRYSSYRSSAAGTAHSYQSFHAPDLSPPSNRIA